MASAQPTPTREICDEPLVDENGKPTGKLCDRVHMSTGSPTCPECRWRLTDAFWATMGMTTPDTGARPAQFAAPPEPPAPPPKRKRPGKRSRARKERS